MTVGRIIETEPLFDAFDRQFAALMTRLDEIGDKEQKEMVSLIAALASRFSRDGHVCFDWMRAATYWEEAGIDMPFPDASVWTCVLESSSVIGRFGDYRPLIIDGQNRIYLYRYWKYQQIIADFIKQRVQMDLTVDYPLLSNGLLSIFKDEAAKTSTGEMVNQQSVLAAWIAVTRGFCVISGGPGTGKTTTVAKILALLMEQSPDRALQISLTAPTGKAAARLGAAVKTARHWLNGSPEVINAIPETALTIHRFLGSRFGSSSFRHHADNPVSADVVVVDEASMVDVSLLAKLISALPDKCRLILVGDKDQLASVEAGAVFADICAAGQMDCFTPHLLNRFLSAGFSFTEPCSSAGEEGAIENERFLDDSLVQLEKNYRFPDDSGINRLRKSICDGRDSDVIATLTGTKYDDVCWMNPDEQFWEKTIAGYLLEWFSQYMAVKDDIGKAFHLFEHFRILCALREGPHGVRTINNIIEAQFKKELHIDTLQPWYPGRPIMVTRNDYQRNLFNGDVGLTLKDPNGDLRVYFIEGEGLRWFHPRQLPEHETVFAMTVHKSQGTEFSNVMLILPEKDTPVLNRELLYTAVTRATSSVTIAGTLEIVEAAVARKTSRTSGLVDELAVL